MLILGIETSCDETAAAVVANGTKVISSTVSSSEDLQKKWGGIIPEQAAREQLKFIMPVIQETLGSMKIETCDIAHSSNSQVSKYSHIVDAIAVTVGPGLIGSLLIGVETAKTLSWVWKKPLIPINHLIAHIYANFINQPAACLPATIFPALCLIVEKSR
jgi:N6-L-threonylcarbamoyladenine synthase